MTPNAALFFAAGLGTRMAPLTDDRPKPMIEVAGKPLLRHAIDMAEGIERKVVNVHYRAGQIRDAVADGVMISDETDQLLETGGGLRRALPLLGDGPVFTMNTDAVWKGPNPFEMLRSAWREEMGGLLLLIDPCDARGHVGKGDFLLDENAHITPGQGLIYTGCQIIRPDRLSEVETDAFYMWELWNRLLDERSLYGLRYTGNWCDVGRPDCIPIAEEMLRQ